MVAPNVAVATNLNVVARHLDAAASRLGDAVELDSTYRWRPWSMRPKVHDHLDAAASEFRAALGALPTTGDGGFHTAREAVERLSRSAVPDSLGNLGPARDPQYYRREHMHTYAEQARNWASVVREGARLLEDPATTPATARAAALQLAGSLDQHATADDVVRLAALDELPEGLRPDLPVPVTSSVVHSIGSADTFGIGDVGVLLDSWARRTDMLERPGFDRTAAIDELARALELEDPTETLRVVRAIDQLPGHVRPDLPHVHDDWNWTKAAEYRNPGKHERGVEALRARLSDIRSSATLEAAPSATLDEVERVVGPADSTATLDDLTALRDLPGFPGALVAADQRATAFDVTRVRVWLDSQRLAARQGVTREEIVAELHRSLDALEDPTSGLMKGGSGSGAALADRLEGPRRPATSQLTPHEALVRIAAIDHLPAGLRPDLPAIIGIGSRIDAAAHQSPRAFDHARDLLRLRAWASQQPRHESAIAHHQVAETTASRSALRRFLDPSPADADLPPLTRSDQADVLVQVLTGAGTFSPRLHHGALTAAERFLETTTTRDALVRTVVDRTLEQARRNLQYTQGIDNPGYVYHPDYAELGAIAESIKLLRSFEQLDAPKAAGTLVW